MHPHAPLRSKSSAPAHAPLRPKSSAPAQAPPHPELASGPSASAPPHPSAIASRLPCAPEPHPPSADFALPPPPPVPAATWWPEQKLGLDGEDAEGVFEGERGRDFRGRGRRKLWALNESTTAHWIPASGDSPQRCRTTGAVVTVSPGSTGWGRR